jgi:hypothetical protein
MYGKRLTQLAWLALALMVAPACDAPSPDDGRADLGAPGTAEGAPVDTLAARQDSLLSEVAENARLLTQISEELSKVEGLSEPDSGTVESPASAPRERLLHQVRQITSRLADTEKRLATTRRQLRAAGRTGDSLTGRVNEMEKMLADFEAVVESQRTTVESLTERVTALETETLALRDTITTMENEENTAYYVVGTKEELLDRGIITKEGGSRVLFIFGKRGETLVPARDIDTTQFTRIDIRQVTEIPLPDSAAEYLIASRQDLTALAPVNGETSAQYGVQYRDPAADSAGVVMDAVQDSAAQVREENAYEENGNGDDQKTEAEKRLEKGRVRGSVRIADPGQFWLPSKFLIIVRT